MSTEMQRTNEWYEQRLGRFTASEVHALMGVKGLGDTGISLARKKAQEIVFGRDESWDVETCDMKRGREQEEIAFEIFKAKKGLEFVNVEKAIFFPISSYSGASPDGLVGSDAVLEIKCPRPESFFKMIELGEEAVDKKWIFQMQLQMKATNSVMAHLFLYLEWKGEQLTHEIVFEYNEIIVEEMMSRIRLAVKHRDEIVKVLRQNLRKVTD